MLSSIEKLPEVQKATHNFIAVLKRAARRLPANRSQVEGDLSLFVSNLWDKLETEITSEFRGESRLVERAIQGTGGDMPKCCHCKEANLIKTGSLRDGRQRYYCKSCKRSSRDQPVAYMHPICMIKRNARR